jgi:hypothetical protein
MHDPWGVVVAGATDVLVGGTGVKAARVSLAPPACGVPEGTDKGVLLAAAGCGVLIVPVAGVVVVNGVVATAVVGTVLMPTAVATAVVGAVLTAVATPATGVAVVTAASGTVKWKVTDPPRVGTTSVHAP